jgi:hypothetical protein
LVANRITGRGENRWRPGIPYAGSTIEFDSSRNNHNSPPFFVSIAMIADGIGITKSWIALATLVSIPSKWQSQTLRIANVTTASMARVHSQTSLAALFFTPSPLKHWFPRLRIKYDLPASVAWVDRSKRVGLIHLYSIAVEREIAKIEHDTRMNSAGGARDQFDSLRRILLDPNVVVIAKFKIVHGTRMTSMRKHLSCFSPINLHPIPFETANARLKMASARPVSVARRYSSAVYPHSSPSRQR